MKFLILLGILCVLGFEFIGQVMCNIMNPKGVLARANAFLLLSTLRLTMCYNVTCICITNIHSKAHIRRNLYHVMCREISIFGKRVD